MTIPCVSDREKVNDKTRSVPHAIGLRGAREPHEGDTRSVRGKHQGQMEETHDRSKGQKRCARGKRQVRYDSSWRLPLIVNELRKNNGLLAAYLK